MMSTLLKTAVAAAVLALGIGQAQASTYYLSLAGQGSNFYLNNSGPGYQVWELPSLADNPNPSNPASPTPVTPLGPGISVQVGDIIDATITLTDGLYTIPASGTYTVAFLELRGASFPSGNTETDFNTMQFYDAGSLVLSSSGNQSTTTSGQLSAGDAWFPGPSITFDTVTVDFTIGTNPTSPDAVYPAIIDSADFVYNVYTAPPVVPEPISMIFFGTGLVGVVGYVARRRNR